MLKVLAEESVYRKSLLPSLFTSATSEALAVPARVATCSGDKTSPGALALAASEAQE